MSETQDTTAGARGQLARLSIEKPVLTWLIVWPACSAAGGALRRWDGLEDPSFTIKESIVFTPYPGASAEEVEAEVSERLETAIQQMSQLEEVRSESSPGMSEIHVLIRDEYDGSELPQIWDELRKRVNDAQGTLPPGAGPSQVFDDFGDVYGILYAVATPGYSDAEVRDIADYLRREFLDGGGCLQGGDRRRSRRAHLYRAPAGKSGAPGLAGRARPGDSVQRKRGRGSRRNAGGRRLLSIELPQTIGGVASIENLLINPGRRRRDAAPVRYRRGPPGAGGARGQYIYHNGERAFTIGVSGLADANIVDVGAGVEASSRT
jgi:multidrug efflux pump subunit AcrB